MMNVLKEMQSFPDEDAASIFGGLIWKLLACAEGSDLVFENHGAVDGGDVEICGDLWIWGDLGGFEN